jgi:hypothetical protein
MENMPNLSSFSVLNQKVKKYKNDYDLDTDTEAFTRLILKTVLRLNDDEVEEAITEGGMDGGMDAIHIEGRNVHFFNTKYTTDFDKTKNNFPEAEIDKIIVTTESIYGGSLKQETVNAAIWEKYQEIRHLFEEGPLHFKIYLVSNKLKPVEHAKNKLENALLKYRFIDFYYFDQEDIVTEIIERRVKKIDGALTFIDKMHFEKSDGPIKTVIGAVAAKDIIKLITDSNDPHKIDEDIFNQNIRLYKPLHRINQAIIRSALSDDNFQFFYLNNGITLLCEECGYTPHTRTPSVPLKNVQIINGGQTTHSLFEAAQKDPDKLENVELLVRICIAKTDDPISDHISETSNSQIPVGTRDLHSNDPIQIKLQEEFEALGYFYERKENQFADKPIGNRLSNELLGQIYLAYYLDQPSEAKNNKNLVFIDKYDEIFDETKITAHDLLRIYEIYLPLLNMKKVIQSKKRKKESIDEKEAFISRATFHILNAIKFIITNKINDITRKSEDKKERSDKIEALYTDEITAISSEAISYVGDVVKQTQAARGDLYTHDKFFKEIGTNKIIREYVSKRIAEKNTAKQSVEGCS